MLIKTLYKSVRPDGGVTVSPIQPENGEYSEIYYRLIAEEGKMLTQNGVDFTLCIDVNSSDGWFEVDAPEEEMAWGDTDVKD